MYRLLLSGILTIQIRIKYNNEISKLKQRANQGSPLLKDALHTDIPLSLMYGIGLGYQLGYLYERCKVRNLFLLNQTLICSMHPYSVLIGMPC